MFITAFHPSVTFLIPVATPSVSCTEHLNMVTVAAVTGSMVLAGGCAVWLWRRIVLIDSAWRNVVAFLVAVAGMAVVMVSITANSAVTAAFMSRGQALAGEFTLQAIVLAVLGIAVGVFAVECPPMRRTAWRHWADHPRGQRLGLMLSLGYLGLGLLPTVLLWFAWWVMVVELGCDNGWVH